MSEGQKALLDYLVFLVERAKASLDNDRPLLAQVALRRLAGAAEVLAGNIEKQDAVLAK